MPANIKLSVNGSTFEADGDVSFDAGLIQALRIWVMALGPDAQQQMIDQIAEQMKTSTDAEEAAAQQAAPVLTPFPTPGNPST